MAKLVNVLLVLMLFVACASIIIEVKGTRDINGNFPAEAPYIDPRLETCRITGPCANSLSQLIMTKAMPGEKDVICCQEL
ncbi:hypothetical protein MKX01_030736, partial [Papaver californicum]